MSAKNFANKISNNGTAKITATTGYKILVTAVTNAHSADTTVTFADDSDLGVLELPKETTLNLTTPIMCASFTPSNANMSVVYYEAKPPYFA
jgi:hypothetical protein